MFTHLIVEILIYLFLFINVNMYIPVCVILLIILPYLLRFFFIMDITIFYCTKGQDLLFKRDDFPIISTWRICQVDF